MAQATHIDQPYGSQSYYVPPDIIAKESMNPILNSLLLTWAGCYIRAQGHQVIERTMNDYVMIYCVGGRGWLAMNDERWSIEKGAVFVCPPDQAHSYGADVQEPWTKYWVHFRGGLAKEYMELLGFTATVPLQHIGENAKVLSWMQDVFQVLERGYTQNNLLLASSYLHNTFAYMQGLIRQQVPRRSLDVDGVITYMLDNLAGSMTLDAIAAYANVSKYHLVRVFKETTGYTPIDYYTRLKMQRACQLLESSTITVGSIGSALGFSSAYYFSTTFKRVIGQSPQQYRRLLR